MPSHYRISIFIVCGVICAILGSRGAFHGSETGARDQLTAVAAWFDARFTASPTSRVVTCEAAPADPNVGFTRDEVLGALSALAKFRAQCVVLAFPEPLPEVFKREAKAIAGALYQLGRVVVVLGRGAEPPPARARLDRIGRGPDLAAAPTVSSPPAAWLDAVRLFSVADAVPDPDGRLRGFAVAYGPRAETVPSLPVAIASCALRESSLFFSEDARTLESFGNQDLALEEPNSLRVRFHSNREFAPDSLAARVAALDRDEDAENGGKLGSNVRNPIVIVAFAGSSLFDLHETPLRDTRTGLEIVADCVEDLLRGRSLHTLSRRAASALIVIVACLIGIVLSRTRAANSLVRTVFELGALLAAYSVLAMAAVAVASLLLPIVPVLAAAIAGTITAPIGAAFLQRPTTG